FAVGPRNFLPSFAQARKHGLGRRENDGHGWSVCRIARNVLDHPARKHARKRHRGERGPDALLKRIGPGPRRARKPERSWESERTSLDNRKPVPVAVGNIPRDRSARDCLPKAYERPDFGFAISGVTKNLQVSIWNARGHYEGF